MGEARRFDGSVAPSGWVLAQGQTLTIADAKKLYSILGTSGGGDGKTTFKIPALKYGAIVAIAGIFPSSPAVLAGSGRSMRHADSLGPGAVERPPRMIKPPSAKLMADRKLLTSGIRVGAPNPVRIPAEVATRVRQAFGDARTTALAQLTPANASRLDGLIGAYLNGQIALNDAALGMRTSLSGAEAGALLRIHDDLNRRFRPDYRADGINDVPLAASKVLLSLAITNEQISTASRRGVELR